MHLLLSPVQDEYVWYNGGLGDPPQRSAMIVNKQSFFCPDEKLSFADVQWEQQSSKRSVYMPGGTQAVLWKVWVKTVELLFLFITPSLQGLLLSVFMMYMSGQSMHLILKWININYIEWDWRQVWRPLPCEVKKEKGSLNDTPSTPKTEESLCQQHLLVQEKVWEQYVNKWVREEKQCLPLRFPRYICSWEIIILMQMILWSTNELEKIINLFLCQVERSGSCTDY